MQGDFSWVTAWSELQLSTSRSPCKKWKDTQSPVKSEPGPPFIASTIKFRNLHFIYFLGDSPLYSSIVEGANHSFSDEPVRGCRQHHRYTVANNLMTCQIQFVSKHRAERSLEIVSQLLIIQSIYIGATTIWKGNMIYLYTSFRYF